MYCDSPNLLIKVLPSWLILSIFGLQMGHNNAKLRAEMDARLREEMEEDDRLRKEVQEMKRQHLQREKERVLHEMLDLQVTQIKV